MTQHLVGNQDNVQQDITVMAGLPLKHNTFALQDHIVQRALSHLFLVKMEHMRIILEHLSVTFVQLDFSVSVKIQLSLVYLGTTVQRVLEVIYRNAHQGLSTRLMGCQRSPNALHVQRGITAKHQEAAQRKEDVILVIIASLVSIQINQIIQPIRDQESIAP